MNTAIRIAIAAAFGVATVLPAFAQDQSLRPNLEWNMSGSTDQLGSPAGDMATDREIRLGSNPGNIGVLHGETVKFLTADGREFRWRFDTLKPSTSFPLASIAPDSSMTGKVFVNSHGNEG